MGPSAAVANSGVKLSGCILVITVVYFRWVPALFIAQTVVNGSGWFILFFFSLLVKAVVNTCVLPFCSIVVMNIMADIGWSFVVSNITNIRVVFGGRCLSWLFVKAMTYGGGFGSGHYRYYLKKVICASYL